MLHTRICQLFGAESINTPSGNCANTALVYNVNLLEDIRKCSTRQLIVGAMGSGICSIEGTCKILPEVNVLYNRESKCNIFPQFMLADEFGVRERADGKAYIMQLPGEVSPRVFERHNGRYRCWFGDLYGSPLKTNEVKQVKGCATSVCRHRKTNVRHVFKDKKKTA